MASLVLIEVARGHGGSSG
jgi:hypothetical protein